MAYPRKNPFLYNDVLQIHISKLKRWGYLNPQQIKSGTINWSRNEIKTGSASIKANTCSEQPYIELNYKCNNESRNYKVYLTSTPSNLNRCKIWYFICPHTKKRCRKLYLIGDYFLHRLAFMGCMYETQTKSKRDRIIERKNKPFFKGNEYDQLQAKHFKMYYNGKPTKRYLRILKVIKQANALPNLLFEAEIITKKRSLLRQL